MPNTNTQDKEEPASTIYNKVINLPDTNSSKDPKEPTTINNNIISYALTPPINRIALIISAYQLYNPNNLHNTSPLWKKILKYSKEYYFQGNQY